MADTIAELMVVLGLKDEMSEGLEGSKSKLQTFASTASTVAVGVGVLSVGLGSTVDRFKTLDSAAQVTALQTGRTTEEMQNLINGLYSADTSLEESASLFEALGKAGVTSVDDLKAAGDAFDSLGDAIGKPGDSLVTSLSPAFKAFGIDVADAGKYTDGLTTMFMTTGVSAEEFGTAITRMAPKLASNGLSMQDMEVALVGLSEKGIKGRMAMQALAAGIDESADSNKDGKISQEEFNAAVGLTGEQVETASKKITESTGATDKYAEAQNSSISSTDKWKVMLDKVVLTIGGMAKPLDDVVGGLSVFGGTLSGMGSGILILQSIGPALSAMSGGSIIAGLSGLAGSISAVGTSMMAALIPALIAAAPIIIGIGVALAALYILNELGVFTWIIEQGAAFGEWISNFDIGKAFQGVLDFLTGLPDLIIKTVTGAGGGAEGIAGTILNIIFPPLLILDLLNKAFPQIGEFFSGIGQKVIDLITGIDPNTVISVILGIIFPPSLILSALGVNWIDVGKWFLELPGLVLKTIQGVVADAEKIAAAIFPVDLIKGSLQTGIETALKIFDSLKVGWETISNAIKTVWDTILKVVFDDLGVVVDTVIKAVIVYFENLKANWELLSAVFKTVWDTVLKVLWDAIQLTIETVIGVITALFDKWKSDWNVMVEVFKVIWETIFKPVWDALQATVQIVIDTAMDLLQALSDKWNEIVTFFQSLWDEIFKPLWYTLQSVVESVIGIVVDKLEGFLGTLKTVYDWAVKTLDKLKEFLGLKGSSSESSSIPAYATGTRYIAEDAVVKVHKGEGIIPASQNMTGSYGGIGSSGIIHTGNVILPNVTNYNEFKKEYEMDMRRRNARRNAI